MSVVKEVFVGRKEEIGQFFEFLKRKDCPAFVVIGEPGIGKSSFMKEIAGRLKSDEKVVVGFYEVPFSGGVADPFVGVVKNLMDSLAIGSKEQVKGVLKRFGEAVKNIAIKKGDRFARAFVKDLVTKLVGEHVVEELVQLKDEFDRIPTAYSLADDFVREHRSEFIFDLQEFFEGLVKAFPNKEFVLLIDQFERAPMSSCDVFLDFVRGRQENVHVGVALKVEEKGSERFNYLKPHLERIEAEIGELSSLSIEEIGEWMRLCGKDFSHPELRKIEKLSAGLPFTISEWLKTSKECDLRVLEDARGGYCGFVKWRMDGLKDDCKLMLHRLSVLIQPLSVEGYGKLTAVDMEHCGLFLRELVNNWIFDKYSDMFWFRHELIRFCIEQDLTEPEKRKYHENAAQFFQQKYDEAIKADKKVSFDVGLGCAYHWHLAEKYKESFNHNTQVASFCKRTGSLDVAQDCYLRAIEDAEALGDEDSKMGARGDLAQVYHVWGRIDEAFKTHNELLEYYRRKNDEPHEAVALQQLAIIEDNRGNIDKAEELCNQSLKTFKKLGDQEGISTSLLNLAIIEQHRGNYDEAKKLYNQSLEIKQKLGDKRGMSYTLHHLALIHQFRGNYAEAIKLHAYAMKIDAELGDQSSIAKSLHALAMIEQGRGNFEKAAELYNQNLEAFKKLGDQRSIASTLYQLGLLSESLGKLNIASDYFLKVINIFQKTGDKLSEAKAKRAYERVTKQKKQ